MAECSTRDGACRASLPWRATSFNRAFNFRDIVDRHGCNLACVVLLLEGCLQHGGFECICRAFFPDNGATLIRLVKDRLVNRAASWEFRAHIVTVMDVGSPIAVELTRVLVRADRHLATALLDLCIGSV